MLPGEPYASPTLTSSTYCSDKLHVSKVGATVLGNEMVFHNALLISMSFPVMVCEFPSGMRRLLWLVIIQLVVSFLEKSCARIEVYPMSSIWSIRRKIVSGLLFCFETKILNGSGSLQVIIAGSGKRPSILILGGSPDVPGSCIDEPVPNGFSLRKRFPFAEGCAMLGENWCCRLA